MGICSCKCFKAIDPLDNIPDNIDINPLKNKTIPCKVIDVYDGDTCTIVMFYKNEYCKYKVRLYGYDSPELKPKYASFENTDDRNKEIELANKAKNALCEKVLGKKVNITCMGNCKYGRLLGILQLPDEKTSVNEYMVKNKYGKPFMSDKYKIE